ncbi:DUF1648 domain-containing protein [Methylobacterium sp. Leaf466]|uniref:DUF1648 domain-containing protein n=1 Tax=Methylobacterium sp. Leaf466 TaxID=1736386 RepID=UPI0012E385B9|nr:DUF1648 domain-containing protein [Methylobacterium sp. Leaf466]
MKTIYSIAAAPIIINVSLSLIAAYFLGNTEKIPMHWNTNWQVNLYAPKFVGLSIIPLVSIFALVSFLLSNHLKKESQQIRDVAIIGLILVSSHIFHLYLIKQWFAAQSS